MAQHVDTLTQRAFLVSLPEEAGVIEAGTQHALVSVTNNVFRIAVRVENCKEMRCQLASGILDGKILLVVTHYRNQDFFGKFQVFPFKISQDDGWELGQVDDCVQ